MPRKSLYYLEAWEGKERRQLAVFSHLPNFVPINYYLLSIPSNTKGEKADDTLYIKLIHKRLNNNTSWLLNWKLSFPVMEEYEYPTFGFGIKYAGEYLYCVVIMHEDSFDIKLNNRSFASIAHTEDLTWILASGTILPQTHIDEIGARIEHHYNWSV